MKRTFTLISIFSIIFASAVAFAITNPELPKKKQTSLGLYMTSQDTQHFLNSNAISSLFIDVRSRAEVNFLGTPTMIDANVPYMELSEWYAWNSKKSNFKLEVNSDFASEIARRLQTKGLGKTDTIILMCRSGSRSSKAANLLASLGYTRVYSVVDGFEGDKAKKGPMKGQRVINGWKNNGLPWSYKLEQSKMYKAES